MMNTIAPVWDGNETWLVLGGGGLLAAFPLAYSVLMPALYLPVLLMLAGLILGGFIQGITVADDRFAGGQFDWFTPYTLLVSVGIVAGYALLGATWLMLKTKDNLHGDAKRWSLISAACVAGLLAVVSVATLYVHPRIALRWGFDLTQGFGLDWSVLGPLLPVPLLGLAGLTLMVASARRGSHVWPFVGGILVFLSGYLGLAASFTPYVVPYAVDFRQAAAPENALGLMLVGTAIIVPMILAYTAWVYWVFRGKIDEDAGYHH